jgi:hypothetical protein
MRIIGHTSLNAKDTPGSSFLQLQDGIRKPGGKAWRTRSSAVTERKSRRSSKWRRAVDA